MPIVERKPLKLLDTDIFLRIHVKNKTKVEFHFYYYIHSLQVLSISEKKIVLCFTMLMQNLLYGLFNVYSPVTAFLQTI
jgi:hypothetical protein